MGDVDILRRAAALMRERAEAATRGPWRSENYPNGQAPLVIGEGMAVAETFDKTHLSDANHIASWHPGVAVPIADWLDWVAHCREVIDGVAARVREQMREPKGPGKASQMFEDTEVHALTIARAYLGESA